MPAVFLREEQMNMEIEEILCLEVCLPGSCAVFFVFTFYSFKYTQRFKSYEQEYLEANFDKSLKNIELFWVLIIICKLIFSLLHRIQGRVKGTEITLYALCALTFLVSRVWVKVSGSKPYGNQAFICQTAMEFINGICDCQIFCFKTGNVGCSKN